MVQKNIYMENEMNSRLTPMMKQYMEIKKKYRNEILFFRMGDFYEMFFEDAEAGSKILDIALTSRQNDVPMCGIPYHAAENYIGRLIKAGRRVAICEQMESVPSQGTIVKRDVVRIITPGTLIESNLLQSDANNFLGSIIVDEKKIGLAFVDISTGDFHLSAINKSPELFRGQIARFQPTEIVMRETGQDKDRIFSDIISSKNIPVYKINEWLYDHDYMKNLICETYGIVGTKGLGIIDELDIISAGSIIQYLTETHRTEINHLKYPKKSEKNERMSLDDATITSLELVRNQQDGTDKRTLLSLMNHTSTAMGKRKLEIEILQPLLDKNDIGKRLDIVQYLTGYHDLTSLLQEKLKKIHDIERLLTRFSMGRIFPRNFIAIANSVSESLKLKELLSEQPQDEIKKIASGISDLHNLVEIIRNAVMDEPAISPEHGRVIREGFNPDLDHLYELKTNGKNWILEYQEEEKKRLGINTLKIKYNRVLGYYIEVSKAQSAAIPEEYFRKQTLVGSERYTTEKLQKFESEVLSASEKIIETEKKEIEKLKDAILQKKQELQKTAELIAEIDFFNSLSLAALMNNLTRPMVNDEGRTTITEGRHPVVEKYFTQEVFIPNDIHLDSTENLIMIITGPNMSGKSTYIRMCAIIQLMTQIGSFVPAREADMSIADRIFTRIGASDNISRGESTFLVEMNETANILNNATEKSLVVMDEVGRGTSTYDGLSIAWGIVEYISRYLKAKTLFATHYHELTELGSKKGIINYNVLVKEHLDGVDFLHRVVKGAADKSYGIHVANLAGIPSQIITRSKTILQKLENSNSIKKTKNKKNNEEESEQLEIFNAANHNVIMAIKNIDIENVTPVDALNELHRLKKLIE